jgi:hypothetical protein
LDDLYFPNEEGACEEYEQEEDEDEDEDDNAYFDKNIMEELEQEHQAEMPVEENDEMGVPGIRASTV